MPKALLLHLLAIPSLAANLLLSVPAEGWRYSWKRLPLFLLLWVIFSLFNLLHMLGHALDEILFFGYRKKTISEPVFILGIPRSGTTLLQRILSYDKQFTTFTTWEALLAPSVSEKYLFLVLGKILAPLGKVLLFIRKRLFKRMDSIHQIRLLEPEEDFLLFLPLEGCLLQAFLCPTMTRFWQLGSFDRDVPEMRRRTLLTFYTHCIKKHLHFHGANRRLLSKNPSFTSWTDSLLNSFPDAKLIVCTRPPSEVVPSQLSSLRPMMNLIGSGKLIGGAQKHMIDLLHHYYEIIQKHQQNQRLKTLSMESLRDQLETTLESLQPFLSLPSMEVFAEEISRSHGYQSNHQYNLAEFSLSENDVNEKFSDVWPQSLTKHE